MRQGGLNGAVGARLAADARVRYVEPNYVVSADATPNDPSYAQLWGMNNTGQTGGTPDADIDAPEAWDVQTGSSSVVVGVTDSGVDFGHPDLTAQQWVNTGENCGSSDPSISCADRTDGVDDDGNSLIDDWRGWDWVNNDNNPLDDNNHGTHVAGTIGAVGNNSIGVVGANWNVKIAAMKFLNAAGNGSTANAISATLYSANEGIPISNNSWGGGGFSQALLDAIEYGASRGMLFVAAAGNFNVNNDVSPHYPSSYASDVITAVAATEHTDSRWSSSNYGATSVDLGAPGVGILSTIPGGGYASFNGTSMATPHVAGAAALVKARYPSATAYGLKALLMRTVDPNASLNGLTVTGGRLNMNSAVSCANAAKGVVLAPFNGFSVNTGQPLAIRLLGANCASPAGLANVSVNVNGTPVTMSAASPDSGRYTGTFTPGAAGPLTVTATVTIGGTSDVRTVTGSATGGGGGGGYTCADVGDPWVDATGGTQLPLSVDDGFTAVTLPFSFSHFGQSHTQAFVSTNGFLTLGSSSGANAASNPVIPAAAAPNGVIAPFWDDLSLASSGAVYTLTTGTAPNRVFHVEWLNVPHFVNVGAATFEVSLYETSNEIRFRYLDTVFGNVAWDAGRSATAGVESQNGTQGTQYSRNQALLTAGKAISCSQGAPPPPPTLTVTTTTLPGGTVSQAYSQQVTAAGGSGTYGWSVVSGSLPPGLSLSPSGTPSATITGTPTTPGTYPFTVQVTDGASANDTQALSITIAPAAALAITTTSVADGTVDSAYSQTVTATGGSTPYSWNVVSGSLPPGLSLSPSGTPSATISGTPTTEGTFAFTVQVGDAAAATDTQALSITVGPAAPPGGSPAFGSAGTATAALAAELAVPYPSGVVPNDLVILLAMTRDTVDITTPAGFTEGGGHSSGSLRAEWFWRRATGGETGDLTITKASGTNLFFARMYRFSGVRTTGAPYEGAATAGSASVTVLTPADVTTLGANRRVVVLTALEDDLNVAGYAGGTAAVPEDVAEAKTPLGTDGALGLTSVGRTSAEAFDVGSQTIAFNRRHALFTFALVP